MIDIRPKSIVYNLKSKTWRQRRSGFTLIELLVVIFIIGLLVTLTTVSFTSAQKKSRDAKRKQDLQTIKQALESYYQTNGIYPDADIVSATGKIKCFTSNPDGTYDISMKDWGTAFTCSNKTYLNKLPKDPKGSSTSTPNSSDYYYCTTNSSGTSTGACNNMTNIRNFQLNAHLENTTDPDLSNMPCTPDPGTSNNYNYCIINP